MKTITFLLASFFALSLVSCGNGPEKVKESEYEFKNSSTGDQVYTLERATELKAQGKLIRVEIATCKKYKW